MSAGRPRARVYLTACEIAALLRSMEPHGVLEDGSAGRRAVAKLLAGEARIDARPVSAGVREYHEACKAQMKEGGGERA